MSEMADAVMAADVAEEKIMAAALAHRRWSHVEFRRTGRIVAGCLRVLRYVPRTYCQCPAFDWAHDPRWATTLVEAF